MTLWPARLRWRLVIFLLPLVALVSYYAYTRRSRTAPKYITAEVNRGPIIRSVVATGTVNPVITVQVGTYDSGPIIAIYADFNSPVKAGQLIAKIDPRPFQVKVNQAVAALANASAQLAKDKADATYKKLTFERDSKLLKEKVVSQDVFDNAHSACDQAAAQVALDYATIQQRQADLDEAKVNLDYTNIVSPVDGTVVSRNVDVGQTVAASFQTPTLFLIARDLTQMQVDTNVSESDIGNVQAGQTAQFSVDAFQDRVFEGTIGQVRQAPMTVQNVVTYDVVVKVANPEFLLKPGMTANVTIITGRRNSVLRVPLQALRFSPDKGNAAASNLSAPANLPRQGRVWVEERGALRPVSIITGLDDGNYAEVLNGGLKPGDVVVVDEVRTAIATGGAPSASPLRFPR
jgi:HlyD family secretion protein